MKEWVSRSESGRIRESQGSVGRESLLVIDNWALSVFAACSLFITHVKAIRWGRESQQTAGGNKYQIVASRC